MVLNKRRKLCFGLLLACCTIFGFSLSDCLDVSAFTFGSVGQANITAPTWYGTTANGDPFQSDSWQTLGDMWEFSIPRDNIQGLSNWRVTRMVAFTGNNGSIPAGSLFTFRMRYLGPDAIPVGGEPAGSTWSLLNYDCVQSTNSGAINYTCTYWGYAYNSLTAIQLINTLAVFPPTTSMERYVYIDRYFNYVRIYSESGGSGGSGLTQADKDFLSQQIALITSANSSTTSAIQQLNTIVSNQGDDQQETLDNIEDAINEQNERDEQAIENISEQTPSDISGATDQQTTSIISFIGGFIASLQNVQPSNCTLTLPFPNFAGGSRTVNICNGKQYAPSIISIASSLLLIITFIPLAFIVLRMIYNEIRSWTNG